jgi:small subunit ribosomal protein S16
MGRKKLPIYKIVASDSRAPRDGRFIESLGSYNPNMNPVLIDVKETRVLYWLKTGAQPTFTVKNLLSRKGILLKLHLSKKGADEQKINQEFDKWSALQENKIMKEGQKRVARKAKKKKSKTTETGAPEAGKEPAADQVTTPSQ